MLSRVKWLATFVVFVSVTACAFASGPCTQSQEDAVIGGTSSWPPNCPIDLFPDKRSSYALTWLGSFEHADTGDPHEFVPDHLMSATILDADRLLVATATRMVVVGRSPVNKRLPQLAEFRTDFSLPSNLDGATDSNYYFHKFFNSAVYGDYVYATTRYDPIYAFQITGTGHGTLINKKWMAPRSRIFTENLQVVNDNLFVVHHADGVEVLSLADPAHPTSRAILPLTDSWGLSVRSDGNMLVADGAAGVQWVQFDQNTNTLSRISGETLQTSPGVAFDVEFIGPTTALAAIGGNGLAIYYFNPLDPDPDHRLVRTGTLSLPGSCVDVEPMMSDMAVVACRTWVHVVKIDSTGVVGVVASAKRHGRVGRQKRSFYPSINIASHVTVSGDQMYVASWDHVDLYRLTGNPALPDIRLSSQRVHFGGSADAATVTVANGGRGNLIIRSVKQSTSPHISCHLDSTNIAPGSTSTLTVSYDGVAPVQDTVGCVISSNDGDDGDGANTSVAIPVFAALAKSVDPGQIAPDFNGNVLLRDYSTSLVETIPFDLAGYRDPLQTGDQVVHFAIWGTW